VQEAFLVVGSLQSREADTERQELEVPQLYDAHVAAKNALYSLEGLDSALEALDRVIASHEELYGPGEDSWKSTQRDLLYSRDLFRSTRQRMRSVQSRLNNVINLV